MTHPDWARKRAVECWKELSALGEEGEHDIQLIAHFLRQARLSGLEEAAKIVQKHELSPFMKAAEREIRALKEKP